MKSLTQALIDYDRVRSEKGPLSVAVREAKSDVLFAGQLHIGNSYIATTHPDGSSGRREVLWNADEQCFVDWGNNFWLYGPYSRVGLRAGGKWVITARDPSRVITKAILDLAERATKFDRVQDLWCLYWQLLLMDLTHHNNNIVYDLHVEPLKVESLSYPPEYRPTRQPDRILV